MASSSRGEVHSRPRVHWAKLRAAVAPPPGLVAELCRVFHAKEVAMECLLRHGQILVDGFIMRVEYDQRWTEGELRGRIAAITYYHTPARREVRLYEPTQVDG